MNKTVRIVIMDTGVKTDHVAFRGIPIDGISIINSKNGNGINDTYGHGTAIFNIIKSTMAFSTITIIKLFENGDSINENDLIFALEYVYQNIDCDLINLSLGLNICNEYKRLYEICQKLLEKGTIIVSAFDNSNSISYPAAFDNVIGVTTGSACTKIDEFEYVDDQIVNVCAKGNLQRIAWVKPDFIMLAGNSFACAHVTCQAAKYMYEGTKSREEILKRFESISLKKYFCFPPHDNPQPFLIKRASIFPFNKEMHSLIRFSSLLDFELHDIYDVKYSGNIGAKAAHILKDNNIDNDYIVKNIDSINWSDIDTLILGHLDELSNLIDKARLKQKIISEALDHNVNIYAFDDISGNVDSGKIDRIKVFVPKVDNSNLPPNRFGKLYRISKPVLGVFGTSSRQGKFTLQLVLREKLLKLGYNIGQIGTEPSALLYGMDYVFPMGYNSSVYVKEFDAVRYLNKIMNDLCIQEKDIIIVGSQSGTITYDTGNIVQFNLPQYTFLMGTQPEAVVLCVNPYDDFNLIGRTIRFIESSIECKVISIVVFPMDLQNNWTGIYGSKIRLTEERYASLKDSLVAKFNLPVFKLGDDSEMDLLVDKIIEFFSEENDLASDF